MKNLTLLSNYIYTIKWKYDMAYAKFISIFVNKI